MELPSDRTYLVPVKRFSEGDENEKWVQFYPFDTWDHPFYGSTTIDKEIATKLKDSFDKGVRGQKIHSDYEHGEDPAKGGKASGTIKQVEVKDDGLWGLVEFTDEAKKEIDAGEWNYWSTAHYDKWTHPQTKETHEYVLSGGGLTNKPYVKGMVPLNFSEVVSLNPDFIKGEVASEEMQNPGEGIDYTLNPDDSGDSGSRIDTPPPGEDGTVPDRSKTVTNSTEGGNTDMPDGFEEIVKNLRTEMGLGDDDDIVEAVKGMSAELAPLRELRKEQEAAQTFSEAYPAESARLAELEATSRENEARKFSEQLSKRRFARATGDTDDEGAIVTEPTTYGLSALALEQVTDITKKFSEKTVGFADFKGVMDTIVNGGIVDYGNKGSDLGETEGDDDDTEKPKNHTEARKMFHEKIKEIQEADELSFTAAYVEATKKYPELEKAYREIKPVVA